MNEFIEGVARAIYEEDEAWHSILPWEGKDASVKEEFRRLARAAILAMMKPTNGMVEAFIETASAQGIAFEEDSPMQYPVPIYQAMLKAALE